MTIAAWKPAALAASQVTSIAVRNPANVLTNVVGVAVRDAGGVLRNVFGDLGAAPPGSPGSITLTPDNVSGFSNSTASVNISTASTTASVAGATGTPTFAWELVTSSGGTWTILSPSAATTQFRRLAVAAGGGSHTATFRVLVTVDGQAAYSGNVTATVENNGTL